MHSLTHPTKQISLALVPILLLLLGTSCGPKDKDAAGADADPFAECVPSEDSDGDCIPNSVEGCGIVPITDTDNDGLPDWLDVDADGDGVSDQIEAGDCNNPRDTDGDGISDYQDRDSDNDGVSDGNEDRDGNGQIGDCTTVCTDDTDCDAEARENCSIAVGATTGVCYGITCSNGETNPLNPDTDGDGTDDSNESTFICNQASADNSFGIKPIRYVDSADSDHYSTANWRIALEVGAVDGVPVINNPLMVESAQTFDMSAEIAEVAGFLVTRGALHIQATDEALLVNVNIDGLEGVAETTPRVSGSRTTSLDGFDTVLSTAIEVYTTSPTTVTALRAKLIPKLLNRSTADVEFPPYPWTGVIDTSFVVTFQTVYRAESAQTVFMGAVVRKSDFDNRTRPTSLFADDFSNGTGLAVSGNGEAIECEEYYADQPASADIMWIVDESGSMSTDRTRIANNAAAFFLKAVDAGLDFRMGITDMRRGGPGAGSTGLGGQPGIFATRDATSSTGDRWILPDQPTDFSTAFNEPSGPNPKDGGSEFGLTQGRDAMARHLPRDSSNPAMVREDAKLVVIYVTDEKPDEIENGTHGAGILSSGNVNPTAAQMVQLIAFMASYVLDFENENAIAHLISEPLPFDSTTCSLGGAEHAFGYYELIQALGGQAGSICADDLGPVLDAMIDSIIGDASPITLSKVPISASISVARDGVLVFRSRSTGWDFRSSSNSVIFFNMPFDPANPSDVVVSYRRWADQVPIE